MNTIRAYFARAKAYLAAHRAARIAAIVLLVLALLLALLHPHGTKHFLVLGMDNYGSLNDVGRSDVVMLVQVDFTRTKITAVTFARDLFIENDQGRLNKINAIIRGSDEETLVEAMERNFGVPIDGWFRVNFTSVIELVDAIGGAELELTSKEVGYLNRTVGVYPDSPLQEGVCRLNGAQALSYARCRALDSDMARGQRQSKLVAAMVEQTRHLSAANIVSVFSSLNHAWRSSYSLSEQVGLLAQALWLRGADVERIGMPFEGYWRYGNAGSTNGVLANLEQNRILLMQALGLSVPDSAAAQ